MVQWPHATLPTWRREFDPRLLHRDFAPIVQRKGSPIFTRRSRVQLPVGAPGGSGDAGSIPVSSARAGEWTKVPQRAGGRRLGRPIHCFVGDSLSGRAAGSEPAHVGSTPSSPAAFGRLAAEQAGFEPVGEGSTPSARAKPRGSAGVDGGLSSRDETGSIPVRGAKRPCRLAGKDL